MPPPDKCLVVFGESQRSDRTVVVSELSDTLAVLQVPHANRVVCGCREELLLLRVRMKRNNAAGRPREGGREPTSLSCAARRLRCSTCDGDVASPPTFNRPACLTGFPSYAPSPLSSLKSKPRWQAQRGGGKHTHTCLLASGRKHHIP